MGILLAFCIVLGGRLIRQFMLLGPDGMWKDHLWMEEAVYAGEEPAISTQKEVVVLTTPLPVNTCSVDSLTLLPGVGKVLAQRIDDARATGLVFNCPEDLKIVKGIGPAMCLRLTPHVIFGLSEADSLVIVPAISE